MNRRTFNDVADAAHRTGTPLVHAIALDTLGRVKPVTTRLLRIQMFGPCKVCGEAQFICEHDDDGETL